MIVVHWRRWRDVVSTNVEVVSVRRAGGARMTTAARARVACLKRKIRIAKRKNLMKRMEGRVVLICWVGHLTRVRPSGRAVRA